MTSAGQVAFGAGKHVCNFASKDLRLAVKKFGSDPFPYESLLVKELQLVTELIEWLSQVEEIKLTSMSHKAPMELNEILRL